MAPTVLVFHGTQAETNDLAAAVANHCTCATAAVVGAAASCGSHALLLDQHTLDRLLFARRIRATLLAEEDSPP